MANNGVNVDHVNYQIKKATSYLALHKNNKSRENAIYWQGYVDALKSLLDTPSSRLG